MKASNRWLRFLRKVGIAVGILVLANLIFLVLPWTPAWFAYWQVPISCTLFIVILGATLFDTFF